MMWPFRRPGAWVQRELRRVEARDEIQRLAAEAEAGYDIRTLVTSTGALALDALLTGDEHECKRLLGSLDRRQLDHLAMTVDRFWRRLNEVRSIR